MTQRTCRDQIACLELALANERSASESDRAARQMLLDEARAVNAEQREEIARLQADLAAAQTTIEELRRELGDEAEPPKPAPRGVLAWRCDCAEPR